MVVRVDDDIPVGPDFVEAHAAATRRSDGQIGVIQPITDLIDGDAAPPCGAVSCQRNLGADASGLKSVRGGLPAAAWGPVCNVDRGLGESLGWYDDASRVRLGGRGVGYRLMRGPARDSSASRVRRARHMVHWTTFKSQFLRGFEAGARMAGFAANDGPDAALHARGVDPNTRQAPPYVARTRPFQRDTPGLRRLETPSPTEGKGCIDGRVSTGR